MIGTQETSYSIVGSLSKEVNSLRQRSKIILISRLTCLDKKLIYRLKNEFKVIEMRIKEIYSIALLIKDNSIKEENNNINGILLLAKNAPIKIRKIKINLLKFKFND